MADIELVIKIDEDSYKATCNGNMLPPDVENVVQGIKNGIPLPKGHGRLIDADAINIHDVSPAYGMEVYGVTQDDIEYEPTIIVANKEN